MHHISNFERIRNYFGVENLPLLFYLVFTRKPFIIDDTSAYLKSLAFLAPHRKLVYTDHPGPGILLETKKLFKSEKSSDQKTLLLVNNISGESFEILASIPIGWVAASVDFPRSFGLPIFKNDTKEFVITIKQCIACGAGIELNSKYCGYCGSTTKGKKGTAITIPYIELGKDLSFEENLVIDLIKNSEDKQEEIIINTIKDLHKRTQKLMELYKVEKNPMKLMDKLHISSGLMSKLALIATNEYYQNLGAIPKEKEEVLSPWCPNCGQKIKIKKGDRKCKSCGWDNARKDTEQFILKIAGIKSKSEFSQIVKYLLDRVAREIGYDWSEFTSISDSLARDVAKWIYEKQLPFIVQTTLTDEYLKKLASILFAEMCRITKGKKWVMSVA